MKHCRNGTESGTRPNHAVEDAPFGLCAQPTVTNCVLSSAASCGGLEIHAFAVHAAFAHPYAATSAPMKGYVAGVS
jgi:hypothetical protein